jgi:hypothetical protein
MNKFIWTRENSLPKEFCRDVIYKFERDLKKRDGVTIGGHNANVKKSTDLPISYTNNWGEEDKIFCNSLTESVRLYKEYLRDNLYSDLTDRDLVDSGYQIQRTIGGEGFYNWHHDFLVDPNLGHRRITFIWYLNDVRGPGGETEFIDGTKITPKEGMILFFPSTWDFVHRGVMPPSGVVKYLCTGWLYSCFLS